MSGLRVSVIVLALILLFFVVIPIILGFVAGTVYFLGFQAAKEPFTQQHV